MRYGVLVTGMVGNALATKLVELGHEVTMGARSAGNEKAVAWAAAAGERAAQGSFADAAAFGEVVVNATAGEHSVDAVRACGEALRGKVLVDVANAIAHDSPGFPPLLSVCNGDSLGEQLQRTVPEALVVKTLNTVNAGVMVDPQAVGDGAHNVFVCGNDAGAKSRVVAMLREFGWAEERIVDVGDITGARGVEMYLIFWLGLMRAFGTAQFNIAVVR